MTQVIGRNDNGYNLDNRPSFIRYRILQLSPIGSVTEHRLGLWYNISSAIEECKYGFTYKVCNRHLGLITLAYNGYRQLTILVYNGYRRRRWQVLDTIYIYHVHHKSFLFDSITMYDSRGYDVRTYDRTERYYRSICLQSRLRSSKRLVRSMRLQNNRSKARMLEQRNYYAIRGK